MIKCNEKKSKVYMHIMHYIKTKMLENKVYFFFKNINNDIGQLFDVIEC